MELADFSLSRTNLSQQIADHLEEIILTSAMIFVKDRLPSEMQLAKQYNVSRPVIREALKLLQERGLVKLKNGSGAYVTRPASDTVRIAVNRIMQVDHISADDLTQVRTILELSAVRLAAIHATDTQIRGMREILDHLSDASLPLKERVALDIDFHIALAKSGGNELLAMFVQVMTSLLADYMGIGVLLDGGIEDSITRHERIYKAVAAHTVDEAVKAMEEHLMVSGQNVKLFDSRLPSKMKKTDK